MSRIPTVHVFIDANTALHFKRPDHVDWCTLTNANDVVLVGAPVLLRELEQQKVINGSSKLRGRAADYIKWLHPFVRHPEAEVRAGVRWLFLPDEPQLDFGAERLSQTIADDHLIASVLHYARQSGVNALVATADLGLEVKLRSRGVGVLELPDDLRLPAEPDPLELENRNLKRQIARIEARMPRLSAAFESGDQHHVLTLRNPNAISLPSLDQVRSDNPYMPGPLAATRPKDGIGVPSWNFTLPLDAHTKLVDTYNAELNQFFTRYQDYLGRHAAWRELIGLHHLVKFVIANDGTAPASNIDLELYFPDRVRPVDEDDLPKEPKPPQPPRQPQDFPGIFSLRDLEPLVTPDLRQMIKPDFDGIPTIAEDKISIRISYSTLKHGFSVTSDSLIFRFADAAAIRAFSAEYRLSADELPDAIEGQLHFRVSDTA